MNCDDCATGSHRLAGSEHSKRHTKATGREEELRATPLWALAQQVVLNSDREALLELLQRPAFMWADSRRVNLVDFVYALSASFRKTQYEELLYRAHALTVDKFSAMPDTHRGPGNPRASDDRPANRVGTDCRHYYRAWLGLFGERLAPNAAELRQEALAGLTLQTFVVRQFHRSLQEARRNANPCVHRYVWRVNGTAATFIMPRAMSGREKRVWLEENVGSLFPRDLEERYHVQELIDAQLNAHAATVFHEGCKASHRKAPSGTRAWSVEHEVSVKGLAQTLADEKADKLDTLRPSIRALGRKKLKGLILAVVEGLSRGSYHEGELARQFGMTASSFSRFCGSKWAERKAASTVHTVPTLWANLTGLLARHERFVLAAQDAGVWESVQTVIAAVKAGCTEGNEDE